MSPFDGMLEFVAVVERGTFTGASRQLGVSVSHISRQVSELERRLSAQLFVRTTRRMQLTEPGRRLFATSQPHLQEILRAQQTLLETQDVIEGAIRISLSGKYAEEHLIPKLTRFCSIHPGIFLDVDVSSRNVDLVGEGFDLAVRMGPLAPINSLVATRLFSVPMHVLASAPLLDRLPPIQSPAGLPPEFCLPLVHRPWDFVKGQRHESVKPAGRFSTNSGAAAIQAAIAGLGIVLVPAYYAHSVVADGRLVQVLKDWKSVEESVFYLVFPSIRHRPLRVRRLVSFLKEDAGV